MKLQITNYKLQTNNKHQIRKFGILFFCSLILFVVWGLVFGNFSVMAATNISSSALEHYAWNDVIGWIDFNTAPNNINVFGNRLEGYASSSIGYIALNCNSTPNGNICGSSDFKISNNGSGNLSGWAWNDAIGWISFDSATAGSPYFYQVSVNATSGDFSGWAWNDAIGWISFSCSNTGTCGTSNYKVKTLWNSAPIGGYLTSSIYDTQVSGGTAVNTIMWRGQANGGSVKFQVASSDSSTPATFTFVCVDSSSTDIGSCPVAVSGEPQKIKLTNHNNKRYFRYRIYLYSDNSQTLTPEVEDVIINYSP